MWRKLILVDFSQNNRPNDMLLERPQKPVSGDSGNWLSRQTAKAKREIETWPEWKREALRREAGGPSQKLADTPLKRTLLEAGARKATACTIDQGEDMGDGRVWAWILGAAAFVGVLWAFLGPGW